MKTIEEMYKEITGSEELLKEYKALADKEAVEGFLKALGCEADVDKFAEYIEAQSDGELADAFAERVAGGIRKFQASHRPAKKIPQTYDFSV